MADAADNSRLPRWVYFIPCCGGWCAPTRSPETSCLRHVSNEYTLPLAKCFLKIGPTCEWSRCCIALGKCGVAAFQSCRAQAMLWALLVSMAGFLLTLFAWLGTLWIPGLIVHSSWSRGVGHVILPDGEGGAEVFTSWIGARGRVDEVNCNTAPNATRCQYILESVFNAAPVDGVYRREVRFDWTQVCEVLPIEDFLLNISSDSLKYACEKCANQASGLSRMVSFSVLTQFAQMMTNLQRTTVFGDVNCQAGVGVITGFTGLASTLSSLFMYWGLCGQLLPTDVHQYVQIEWSLGPAFWCLFAATILKINDITIHCMLATPAARHKEPPKHARGDLVDYLMLSMDPEEGGDDDDDAHSARKSEPKEAETLLSQELEPGEQELPPRDSDLGGRPLGREVYWEVHYDLGTPTAAGTCRCGVGWS